MLLRIIFLIFFIKIVLIKNKNKDKTFLSYVFNHRNVNYDNEKCFISYFPAINCVRKIQNIVSSFRDLEKRKVHKLHLT